MTLTFSLIWSDCLPLFRFPSIFTWIMLLRQTSVLQYFFCHFVSDYQTSFPSGCILCLISFNLVTYKYISHKIKVNCIFTQARFQSNFTIEPEGIKEVFHKLAASMWQNKRQDKGTTKKVENAARGRGGREPDAGSREPRVWEAPRLECPCLEWVEISESSFWTVSMCLVMGKHLVENCKFYVH